MEQTKNAIYASKAQRNVLRWLYHYPNIFLAWSDMLDTQVNFTASWRDENARQHMIKTLDTIGEYFGDFNAREISKPFIKPIGGTPRICFQTFKALLKEDLICRYLNADGKPSSYFQLTPKARQDIEIYELDQLLVDNTKKE